MLESCGAAVAPEAREAAAARASRPTHADAPPPSSLPRRTQRWEAHVWDDKKVWEEGRGTASARAHPRARARR